MLLYHATAGKITRDEWVPGMEIPADVVWIDMLCPTREEDNAAEKFLGIAIPTREEMVEIELSSRLYQEDNAQFMTATMLSKVDTGRPETHAVTFILARETLVTLRYVDTTSFRRFSARVLKMTPPIENTALFTILLDTIVNRMADILERLDHEIDHVTKAIFNRPEDNRSVMQIDFQSKLERIGRCGDLASKVHDSLVSFGRLAGYAPHHPKLLREPLAAEIDSMRKDITGLSDHGTYLTGKVQFLLDATLGMISIQQNQVFKILTVASFIFMPPTLIAGIYGMNFKLMPELNWHFGYPLAMLLMLASAVLPFAYLKQKKLL